MSDYPTENDVDDRIHELHTFDLDWSGEIYHALGWTRAEWSDFVQHDMIPNRPLPERNG